MTLTHLRLTNVNTWKRKFYPLIEKSMYFTNTSLFVPCKCEVTKVKYHVILGSIWI